MRIKQSLCLPCYYDKKNSIRDFCRSVKDIGFAAVEIWDRQGYGNWEETFEAAKSAGLVVASMGGHGTLTDALNKVENHDRIEAELRASIDVAKKYAIPGLICFSGNRNPGQSDYEGLVVCAQGLRRVAKYAEEKGINLNVELLNSRIDHAHYQADHTDWGVALCEMVGSPRVKLLYDIYHMQIMEGDLIRTIQKHIRYIGHFHTAGNPGRKMFNDTQELNYKGICAGIAKTEFDLYLGHEFFGAGTEGALAELKSAFTICDQK